jgi:hypothetical protein
MRYHSWLREWITRLLLVPHLYHCLDSTLEKLYGVVAQTPKEERLRVSVLSLSLCGLQNGCPYSCRCQPFRSKCGDFLNSARIHLRDSLQQDATRSRESKFIVPSSVCTVLLSCVVDVVITGHLDTTLWFGLVVFNHLDYPCSAREVRFLIEFGSAVVCLSFIRKKAAPVALLILDTQRRYNRNLEYSRKVV